MTALGSYGSCIAKGGKPGKLRHGRATVIGGVKRQSESQTLTWHADRNGTRNPKEPTMTTAVLAPTAQPVAIPLKEILPWAIFAGLIALLAIYFVGAEEGATSIFQGMYIHEWVHDGRHLLGFPCH